jgi:hypothetical protein
LGVYDFAAVGAGVELVQSANGIVIADAIKWTTDLSECGTYAPNVVGDSLTYGFYATGHGKNSNIKCTDCHDVDKKHIDHSHRTYTAASDNYQAGYRLKRPMAVPRPTAYNMYEYLDDFALCGNCHNLYEVLGTSEADWSHTNFRDDGRNSHHYHMKLTAFGFDSDYDGVNDSTTTCIACHNPHGAPNQAMIRHGELISTPGTTDKVPALNFCYMTPWGCDTDAALQNSTGSKIDPNTSLSDFMCNSCHTGRTITRAAYLGAKVLTTKADPDPAPADGSTDIVLTALVMDHDDDVTSVTIDLTDIGGSSGTAMYDDGLTGGDETADDGVYTVTTTASDCDGVKSLPVEVIDGDGTGTNNLVMTVTNPLLVDNTDARASSTGTWGTSSWTSGYYGSNYHYHAAASGSDTFTWTPTIGTAGTFEVFARWTQDSSRANDATYTVHHDLGSTPFPKDQRSQGGQWVSLGIFDLDGTDDKVELVQSASGIVVADAIKLVRQ